MFLALGLVVSEELAYAIHPRFGARVVPSRVAATGFFEFLKQFFLPIRQVDGRFDNDVAQQIAVGVAAYAFDAFAT